MFNNNFDILLWKTIGRSMFTSEGDLWKTKRKLLAPLLHLQVIRVQSVVDVAKNTNK